VTNEEILLASKRESLLREARTLAENPAATKQDLKLADVKLAQASSLKTLYERQVRLAAAMGVPVSEVTRGVVTEEQREESQNSFNLRSYLAHGKQARTYSAMNIATDSNGGFFVPNTFFQKVTWALKQTDGLWNDDVITLYQDDHGNALTCPLLDDTAAAAVIVSENVLSNEAEIATIDRLLLPKIPTWRSQKLITSMELLQDAAFPLESLVATAVAGRFQRGISAANVATLISGITSGATSSSGATVSLDDTLNLLQSVDPIYLNQPKTFFGMNFSTLMGLLKIKDADNRYVWNPRTDANGRLLLHNIPIVLMPSLPSAAVNAVGTVCVGDFSRCIRRVVKDSMKIQRYEQAPNLAENGLVAYEGFLRTGFGVLASSSSSSPIKYLTQAAS
jgi:HK97 family phage major capsid protein